MRHRLHHLDAHPRDRPAPTGMRKADGPMDRIQKVKRHAVRIIRHQRDSGFIREQPVHAFLIARAPDSNTALPLGDAPDLCVVILGRSHQGVERKARSVAKPMVIRQDCLIRITAMKAQIHGRKFPAAHASHPGGKRVPHKWNSREGWKGQIGYALFLMQLHIPGIVRPHAMFLLIAKLEKRSFAFYHNGHGKANRRLPAEKSGK